MERNAGGGGRRRATAEGARSTGVRVRLTPHEQALIRAAASRAELSAGAWMGELAVRQADPTASPAPAGGAAVGVLAELVRLRVELERLRQAITDLPPGQGAGPVVDDVVEVLRGVDAATGEVVAVLTRRRRSGL
jgi:hypothetical protein